jgi:hypothetical protein
LYFFLGETSVMEELLLRARVGDEREIWISEVSTATFAANDLDDLGTEDGYFLMIGSRKPGGAGARILAKTASVHAALELFELITSKSVVICVRGEEYGSNAGGVVTRFRRPASGA